MANAELQKIVPDKPRTCCYTRKKGSAQRMMGNTSTEARNQLELAPGGQIGNICSIRINDSSGL